MVEVLQSSTSPPIHPGSMLSNPSNHVLGVSSDSSPSDVLPTIEAPTMATLSLPEAQVHASAILMKTTKDLLVDLVSSSSPPPQVTVGSTTPPENGTPPEIPLVTTSSPPKNNEVALSLEINGASVTSPVTSQAPTSSTPSLGAWAKPLKIASQHPLGATTKDSDWPSLGTGLSEGRKSRTKIVASTNLSNLPIDKLPPPEMKEDGSYRFPWAAKMNPETRNLYRPLAPTYLQDGTPKITIPEHVFLHGPENQQEYVVGHFHRCVAPPGGLVHAVVNRVWGRNGRISVKRINENSYLFHIPDENTRKWVLQRVIWHVDDCLLFVAPAPSSSRPTFTIPELTSIPVWVTLSNIPDTLYSRIGISHIASGLGEPMLTNRPRLDPTTLGTAKLMVEVELDKAFPPKIALDDMTGDTIHMVNVEYAWIPTKCSRCGQLGHKEKRCLISASTSTRIPIEETKKQPEIPSVSIDELLQHSSASVAAKTMEIVSTVGVISPLQMQQKGKETGSSEATPVIAGESELVNDKVTAYEFDPHLVQSAISTSLPAHESPLVISQKSDLCSPIPNNFTTNSTLAVVSTTSTDIVHTEENTSPVANDQTTLVAEVATPQNTKSMELHHSINNVTFIDHQSATDIAATANAMVETSPSSYQKGNTDLVSEDDCLRDCNGLLESNLQKTRGGREIKPPQKMQEMEWTTVTRGRGRRGRGGTRH